MLVTVAQRPSNKACTKSYSKVTMRCCSSAEGCLGVAVCTYNKPDALHDRAARAGLRQPSWHTIQSLLLSDAGLSAAGRHRAQSRIKIELQLDCSGRRSFAARSETHRRTGRWRLVKRAAWSFELIAPSACCAAGRSHNLLTWAKQPGPPPAFLCKRARASNRICTCFAAQVQHDSPS